jgi:hypothetical protein
LWPAQALVLPNSPGPHSSSLPGRRDCMTHTASLPGRPSGDDGSWEPPNINLAECAIHGRWWALNAHLGARGAPGALGFRLNGGGGFAGGRLRTKHCEPRVPTALGARITELGLFLPLCRSASGRARWDGKMCGNFNHSDPQPFAVCRHWRAATFGPAGGRAQSAQGTPAGSPQFHRRSSPCVRIRRPHVTSKGPALTRTVSVYMSRLPLPRPPRYARQHAPLAMLCHGRMAFSNGIGLPGITERGILIAESVPVWT